MVSRNKTPGVLLLVGFTLVVGACLTAAPADPPSPAAQFFATRLPPGLPVPVVPADNPMSDEKIELGRWLFYDTRLSANGSYSCASCHEQLRAFTDGRARAVGSTGEPLTRSALSLTNVAYNATLGWADTSRRTLEAQMVVPMYNEHPIELGLTGRDAEIVGRLSARAEDVARFRAAFPGESEPVSMAHAIKAIASFERILLSGDSPLDRYLYLDDRTAISVEARRGLDLFFSNRLGCSQCHSGFNLSGPAVFEGAARAPLVFHDTGLFTPDLGLFEETRSKADLGRFRAPTLRNVGATAPYMHDGSIPTLTKVVEHYAAGGRPAAGGTPTAQTERARSRPLPGFTISPSETADVVAFLESLTDRAFLTNPALSDPHIK